MLRLRYSDYDALNDIRIPLQLLPPEGAQGPLAVPELVSPVGGSEAGSLGHVLGPAA